MMNPNPILKLIRYPRNRWQSATVGSFLVHWWPYCEPPHWRLDRRRFIASSSRAFQGVPAEGVDHILDAFRDVEAHMKDLGMSTVASGEDTPVEVVLWDPRFPLPVGWSQRDRPDNILSHPVCYCPLDSEKPVLILLPSYSNIHHLRSETGWLRSSAIHEGFHALLVRWLGRKILLAKPLQTNPAWTKFEEMCAVSLEVRLMREEKAWLDYGRAWRASLALSHSGIQDWLPITQDSNALISTIDREDYAHFAFLGYIEQNIWPAHARNRHWLPDAWEKAANAKHGASPWSTLNTALQPDGGLQSVFLRYVREAVFASTPESLPFELNRTIGRPATARLQRSPQKKIFIIGPLAAQVLSCHIPAGTEAGTLRLTATYGGKFAHIEAACLHPAATPVQSLQVQSKIPSEKVHEWSITMPKSETDMECLILVCQPHYAGQTLLVEAAWT